MRFEDKTLVCKECRESFLWTAGEQAFFAENGLMNMPARCPDCRRTKKRQHGEAAGATFVTRCARCEKETTVPFIPRKGKPVYCASCMYAVRAESDPVPGA